MDTQKFTHRLTKILIEIMFYGGILVCILLPLPFIRSPLTFWLGQPHPDTMNRHLAILISAGLSAVYILYQLKIIFKTLVNGNPFIYKNVSCLRKCGVASFVIAIIFSIRISFWLTASSMIIIILCTLLGLFCLTLKDVFKQAIIYKEENDWTV